MDEEETWFHCDHETIDEYGAQLGCLETATMIAAVDTAPQGATRVIGNLRYCPHHFEHGWHANPRVFAAAPIDPEHPRHYPAGPPGSSGIVGPAIPEDLDRWQPSGDTPAEAMHDVPEEAVQDRPTRPISRPKCEDLSECAAPATTISYIHAGTSPDGPVHSSFRLCDKHAGEHRASPRFIREEPWSHAADPILSQFEAEIVPEGE